MPDAAPDRPPRDAPTMTQNTAPSTEDRDATVAAQEAALRRFTWLVVGSGVVLVPAGLWWGGVDFAGAVLLGFLVVLANFFWTKRAVKSVLFADKPHALLSLSFLVKFGVTGAVLFYAIVRLNVDALGVLVGLSALVLASVLYALDLGLTRR